jgi:hypothetical protein
MYFKINNYLFKRSIGSLSFKISVAFAEVEATFASSTILMSRDEEAI